MRHPLLAQCQQRAQCAEHRVAVIGPAAAIELVAFEARDPGAVPFRPSDHLRLLVEMAVEQHGVLALARDVDEDDGGAPGQPDDLERGSRKRGELGPRPALEQRYGILHIAVRRPIRVEGRRFVGDPNVFDQGRDDLIAPALIDQLRRSRDIDHLLQSRSGKGLLAGYRTGLCLETRIARAGTSIACNNRLYRLLPASPYTANLQQIFSLRLQQPVRLRHIRSQASTASVPNERRYPIDMAIF